MAQWLRSLVLAEDSGSIPRTHMMAHNSPPPSWKGSDFSSDPWLFLPTAGSRVIKIIFDFLCIYMHGCMSLCVSYEYRIL